MSYGYVFSGESKWIVPTRRFSLSLSLVFAQQNTPSGWKTIRTASHTEPSRLCRHPLGSNYKKTAGSVWRSSAHTVCPDTTAPPTLRRRLTNAYHIVRRRRRGDGNWLLKNIVFPVFVFRQTATVDCTVLWRKCVSKTVDKFAAIVPQQARAHRIPRKPLLGSN